MGGEEEREQLLERRDSVGSNVDEGPAIAAECQSVWRQRDQLEAAGMKNSHRTDSKLISE